MSSLSSVHTDRRVVASDVPNGAFTLAVHVHFIFASACPHSPSECSFTLRDTYAKATSEIPNFVQCEPTSRGTHPQSFGVIEP